MAGQPPEPSFQPSGQDQGLTQGRPAWQQPAYNPPPPAPGGQPAYGAPAYPGQDQGYAAPEQQAYPGADQGYPGQDQTYTSLGQGQDYQNYQGYQPPGYGAQQGQAQGQGAGGGTPQWQGIAGVKPGAQPRAKTQKGFLGSLFDFSFTSMVTPKIVKVLYVLAAIMWTVLGLGYVGLAWSTGGAGAGIAVLIIIFPIWVLLGLGVTRVVLESFMVVFRMYEELTKIREQGDNRA
jgi:uncharacterized protein DUF4282